jgi:hypothetical protein
MAVAYFDCFSGAGGDMIVAALLDAGASLEAVRDEIGKLALHGVELAAETVRRNGIAALLFRVHPHGDQEHAPEAHEHAHSHRHLGDILGMIDRAGLPGRAADRARRIFVRLAEAEAKVHGIDVQHVHFHEVGAVDSIVDVVAACVALELLGVEKVLCSSIPFGAGTVTCEHGELPLPAPATAQLLLGAPIRAAEIVGEATTPTAAAVLTTLAESYGPVPAMRLAAVGHGAGTREGGTLPNVLRVFIGEQAEAGQVDSVVELSANVDDCTGEMIGSAIDRLLAAGCLDAWAAPIVMKKSRPAWVVSALCSPHDVAEAERILFAETTTFGIRQRCCRRRKLLRGYETVETPYGPIRMKVGRLAGEAMTAAAEFADCRQAAEAHHVSVKEVLAAAQAMYRQGGRQGV